MRTDRHETAWRPTDNQLPSTDFHYRNPQPMQRAPKHVTSEAVAPTPAVDWAAIQEAWAAIQEAWTRMGHSVAAALEEIVALLRPLLDAMSESAWSAYRDAGAPYGETSAGMLRWLREEQDASALSAHAEAIEQRHRDLAQLRQWGKDMRVRRAPLAELCENAKRGDGASTTE